MKTGFVSAIVAAGLAFTAAAVPSAVCQRATCPVKVDGVLDEEVWRLAKPLSPMRDLEGGKSEFGADIRMAYDGTFLYLSATLPAKTLRAMQGAFAGDTPGKMLAFYEDISFGHHNEGLGHEVAAKFEDEAASHMMNVANLYPAEGVEFMQSPTNEDDEPNASALSLRLAGAAVPARQPLLPPHGLRAFVLAFDLGGLSAACDRPACSKRLLRRHISVRKNMV